MGPGGEGKGQEGQGQMLMNGEHFFKGSNGDRSKLIGIGIGLK